jgi:hypothetical protein
MEMKRLITKILTLCLVLSAGVAVLPVATANAAGCNDQTFFFPKWYDNLCDSQGNIKSPAPQGGKTYQDTANSLGGWVLVIAMNLVKMLLMVVGYVALGGIIYGGFKYMTQGDNSSGTAGARKTIQNAIIGLVISIMSVSIITLVTGVISK